MRFSMYSAALTSPSFLHSSRSASRLAILRIGVRNTSVLTSVSVLIGSSAAASSGAAASLGAATSSGAAASSALFATVGSVASRDAYRNI